MDKSLHCATKYDHSSEGKMMREGSVGGGVMMREGRGVER